MISDHRMILDLRRGLVSTECRYVEADEFRLGVRSLRLVSLSQRHVGLQTLRLRVDSGATDMVLEAGFEGLNLGLFSTAREQDLAVWRTRHSAKGLAVASRASLTIDGCEVEGQATASK
jgi:trehalose/maltose hydrolase-like predicted phosphorylase|uniref:Glycoside hydrolase family 65 N-terminal domain-containing protein n=1 Tax=Caulobacter sp. (strain K31) TaxID=366602 RepID=B0T5T5_CAUSK